MNAAIRAVVRTGLDRGWELMTGIAGGAEAIVITEVETDPELIAAELRGAYDRGKAHAIVVVAGGDVAVEEVAKRPWPADSVARIISVAETLPLEVLSLPPRYREDIERAARHRAETIVERAIARLRDSDAQILPISSTVVVDSLKDAIVEEAERWGADLILVGSHGYRGTERALLGSVSHAVATQAECSVEIARRRRQTSEDVED
jgi:nucleotide-binding universal stress UspA family protein